jgi:hypothetical protein
MLHPELIMHGILLEDLPKWSTAKLREARKNQANRSVWPHIDLILEERKNDAEADHRESEKNAWNGLQKRVDDIERKIPREKSEWRTWSLWVAVIALGWQIGEKIPWRSLLPTPATIDAQKASASIPLLPAHSPESYQQSPDGSKSEAPVESSPPKAATESPLSKTPAEHPRE